MKHQSLLKLEISFKSLLFVIFVLLFSLVFSCTVFAEQPNMSTQTGLEEPTITVPLTQWNRVKNQTSQALSLINASNLKLTEAQSLTMRQSDELNKLKSINEKQANELMKAKQDSMKQEDYLNQTNKYLEIANKEIQQSKKTEARLHRQRDIWAVVAGAATLGAIVAAAK
ncbi:MAG: hypothetical protein E7J30_00950 [Veillonella parvula]|nr:hypothetical protein [Veillonella parvula]